ncbi:chromatin modification- protein VID21 [Quaeritorhiza haematococci]|nr:chromatin modification- protein VID21 [Quaeritorhiza haematococci]
MAEDDQTSAVSSDVDRGSEAENATGEIETTSFSSAPHEQDSSSSNHGRDETKHHHKTPNSVARNVSEAKHEVPTASETPNSSEIEGLKNPDDGSTMASEIDAASQDNTQTRELEPDSDVITSPSGHKHRRDGDVKLGEDVPMAMEEEDDEAKSSGEVVASLESMGRAPRSPRKSERILKIKPETAQASESVEATPEPADLVDAEHVSKSPLDVAREGRSLDHVSIENSASRAESPAVSDVQETPGSSGSDEMETKSNDEATPPESFVTPEAETPPSQTPESMSPKTTDGNDGDSRELSVIMEDGASTMVSTPAPDKPPSILPQKNTNEDTSMEPPQKKRRIVPPIERMVTRGYKGSSTSSPDSTTPASGSIPSSPLTSVPATPTAPNISTVSSETAPSSSTKKASTSTTQLSSSLRSHQLSFISRISDKGRKENAEPESAMTGYRLYEWQMKVEQRPLNPLLTSAHKVVLTKDWQLAREESKQMKLLHRLEQMKTAHLWSMKQIKRHIPPPRSKTHWDYLLDEMKWLHEDYRQERRWKKAVAYNLAYWVADWYSASPEERRAMCVKRKVPATSVASPVSKPEDMAIDKPADEGNTPNRDMAESELARGSDSVMADLDPSEIASDQTDVEKQTSFSMVTAESEIDQTVPGTSALASAGESLDNEVEAPVTKVDKGKQRMGIDDEVPATPALSLTIMPCDIMRPLEADIFVDTTSYFHYVLKSDECESPFLQSPAISPTNVIPTYGPPELFDGDFQYYQDEAASSSSSWWWYPPHQPGHHYQPPVTKHDLVVPVSKFMSQKIGAKPVKRWDDWGRPRTSKDYKEADALWVDGYSTGADDDRLHSAGQVPGFDTSIFSPATANVSSVSASTIPEPTLPKPPVPLPSTIFRPSSASSSTTPTTGQSPSASGSVQTREPLPWNAEEDEALLSLAQQYQFNWALVADSIPSQRLLLAPSTRRTVWECYWRYLVLKEPDKANELRRQKSVNSTNTGPLDSVNGNDKADPPSSVQNSSTASSSSSASDPGPSASSSSSTTSQQSSKKDKDLSAKQRAGAAKADRKARLQRQLSIFELMRKCSRKREQRIAVAQGHPPKKVNLIAHETHQQSQTVAGIDPNARPLTPLELSALKERREKELRQQTQDRQFYGQTRVPGPPHVPAPVGAAAAVQMRGQPIPAPVAAQSAAAAAAAAVAAAAGANPAGTATLPGQQPAHPAAAAAAAAAAASMQPLMRMNANPGAPPLNPEQLKMLMARNALLRGVPFAGIQGQMPLPQHLDPNTAAAAMQAGVGPTPPAGYNLAGLTPAIRMQQLAAVQAQAQATAAVQQQQQQQQQKVTAQQMQHQLQLQRQQQLQNDVQTAAAFMALQNAQQVAAAKMNQQRQLQARQQMLMGPAISAAPMAGANGAAAGVIGVAGVSSPQLSNAQIPTGNVAGASSPGLPAAQLPQGSPRAQNPQMPGSPIPMQMMGLGAPVSQQQQATQPHPMQGQQLTTGVATSPQPSMSVSPAGSPPNPAVSLATSVQAVQSTQPPAPPDTS